MRSRYTPPLCLARSRLTLAVEIPPMCSQPVGDGANLVTFAPAGSIRAGYLDSQCAGDGRSAGKRESISSTLSMAQAYRPGGSLPAARPAEPAAGRRDRLVLGGARGHRVGQPGARLLADL